MTQQEYEQKRRECWETFKKENLDGEVQWQPVSRYDIFSMAFDRGYALGKQEKEVDSSRHNVDSPKPNVDSLDGNVDSLDPKPAEPKFKVGDKVNFKCYDGFVPLTIHHIRHDEIFKCWMYSFDKKAPYFGEEYLEPYTDPEEKTCTDNTPTWTSVCPSQCPSQERLQIAAMAMQGLLANPKVNDYSTLQDATHIDFISEYALAYADALIPTTLSMSVRKEG